MATWLSHLRPFRDYNEKDVINLFTLSGVTLPQGNGVLVSITGAGFVPLQPNPLEFLGDYAQGPGQAAFLNNVQAQRYGVLPKVALCQSGSIPLGITLFDMSEYDENGEPLKYNPRKAAEIEAVISGQAMPVVTRGIFQISGIDPNSTTIVAGSSAFVGGNGLITNTALNSSYTVVTGGNGTVTGSAVINTAPSNAKVGIFLGNTGADGSFIVALNIK